MSNLILALAIIAFLFAIAVYLVPSLVWRGREAPDPSRQRIIGIGSIIVGFGLLAIGFAI